MHAAVEVSRRRWVCLATLVLGAVLLGWTLSIEPGDPTFYLATVLLGVTWVAGAFASGPIHLGRSHDRRPVVGPLLVGLTLLALFCAGAVVVAQIDVLRASVRAVLDHASTGALPVVAVVTALNGVSEELFFRGALHDAVGQRTSAVTRVAVMTAVYALTVIATGSVMLVFAAVLLGAVVGWQRVVTGGVLAPIITHVVWSQGMLFLLPLLVPASS